MSAFPQRAAARPVAIYARGWSALRGSCPRETLGWGRMQDVGEVGRVGMDKRRAFSSIAGALKRNRAIVNSYTHTRSSSVATSACTAVIRARRRPERTTNSRSLHFRAMATHAQSTIPYEAVVVGAGPAGITCVGNLLERKLSPILWVDDGFDGGRINRQYREVPSNTKVKLFTEFATAVAPFRKIVSGLPSRARWDEPSESDSVTVKGKGDNLQFMRDLDQEQGCRLGYAADMCLMLTEGLKKTPGVETKQGRVSSATLLQSDALPASDAAKWIVQVDDTHMTSTSHQTSTLQTKRLVFCTGASPDNPALPVHIPGVHMLDLDIALSPSQLRNALASSPTGTTISVVGASHSAMIVLMNLYGIAASSRPDLRVRWFTRHSLRYAQQMDGWILRDNTGLKGEAAQWAQENLEPDVFDSSDVSRYFTKIAYEPGNEVATFEKHIPGSHFYVQAIGYSRDPLPILRTAGGGEIPQPRFDHEQGSFNFVREGSDGLPAEAAKVPGLFGAGIAFPERVKDPHGNVEMAVGFFKFMKFVRRVVPSWN